MTIRLLHDIKDENEPRVQLNSYIEYECDRAAWYTSKSTANQSLSGCKTHWSQSTPDDIDLLAWISTQQSVWLLSWKWLRSRGASFRSLQLVIAISCTCRHLKKIRLVVNTQNVVCTVRQLMYCYLISISYWTKLNTGSCLDCSNKENLYAICSTQE